MSKTYHLTPREKQVLEKISLGLKIQEIAQALETSPSTVEKQVRSARQAMDARNNEQAVIRALKEGLLDI